LLDTCAVNVGAADASAAACDAGPKGSAGAKAGVTSFAGVCDGDAGGEMDDVGMPGCICSFRCNVADCCTVSAAGRSCCSSAADHCC
jgi:hypothetical protein